MKPWEKYQAVQSESSGPWTKYAQQLTPAAQDANPPGTMVGRAATQALKDTLEVPIRAGKVALKGTVGGLVDLANIAPQAVNLLPGTQGVQPISQRPFLGTQQIEDVYQKLGGEAATAESTLGKAAELAGELTAGFVPLTKVASLPGEKLVEQARSAIQSVTPSLSSMGERRVAKQFQEALGPEGVEALQAGQRDLPPEIADLATTAEVTQSTPLIRQQEAIQRQMQGGDLRKEEARRTAMERAVTEEAAQLAPQGATADTAQSFVEGVLVKDQNRLDRLAQRSAQRDLQKARLAQEANAAQQEAVQQSQAHASKIQTLTQNIEKQRRAVEYLTSQRAALGDQRTLRQIDAERQIADMNKLKESLELQADDLASNIRPGGFDVSATGDRLRAAAEKAESAAKQELQELRLKLGLNDDAFIAPAEVFQEALAERLRAYSAFQQANLPEPLKQVQRFASDRDLNFSDFETMRSVLGEAAKAEKVAGNRSQSLILTDAKNFLDDFIKQKSSLSGAYSEYVKQYKEKVVLPFYNKTVTRVTGHASVDYKTASENVANSFFGPNKITDIRRFRNIVQGNPDAMADMKAVVLDSLASSAVDVNGKFNPNAMQKWLNNHKSVLDEIPEIREEVFGITEPLKGIKGQIQDLTQNEDQLRQGIRSLDEQLAELGLKKEAAVKRLGVREAAGQRASANYDRRMQVLEQRKDDLVRKQALLESSGRAIRQREFEKQVRKQIAENNILKSFVADTPVVAVEKALQSPEQLNRLLTTLDRNPQALAAFRREAWNILSDKTPEQFFDFYRNNEKALNQVFDAQHIANLKQIVDYKKIVESVARAKGKAFGDDVPVHFDTGLTPTTGEGWIRRVLINKTADFLTGNQKEVWKKAMYDKDFAIRLAKFGKSKMTPKETRQEASNLTRMAYLLTLQAAQEE